MGKRIVPLMVAFLALLAVGSCEPPESDNPLSDPAQPSADARLAGVWAGHMDGDEDTAYLIFVTKEDRTTDIALIGADPSDGANVLQYNFFTTVIDSAFYMNLRKKLVTEPDEPEYTISPRYFFAKYDLSKDGTLTISYMNPETVERAIDDGVLEGTSGEDARITSDTKKLAAFVQKSDPKKLFIDFGRFRKLDVLFPPPEKSAGRS